MAEHEWVSHGPCLILYRRRWKRQPQGRLSKAPVNLVAGCPSNSVSFTPTPEISAALSGDSQPAARCVPGTRQVAQSQFNYIVNEGLKS